jgi:membrane-associated protease RseP (regulator of RpoE activity)
MSGGVNVTSVPFIETFSGEPELLSGTNSDNEINQLMSDGWVPVGYSSFNASRVDPSMAQAHARQIGARRVILSSSYQGTISGVMPLTLPNATTTYHSGTVTGFGGSAMYSGTSTTRGHTTSYIPYSVQRYEYMATYWIKRKSGGWGIICRDLNLDQRKDAETNKGIFVANLANNGSAYDADILPGDIIISIGGTELRGCNDYESVAASTIARNTNVVLIRGGERMRLDLFVHPYS